MQLAVRPTLRIALDWIAGLDIWTYASRALQRTVDQSGILVSVIQCAHGSVVLVALLGHLQLGIDHHLNTHTVHLC